MEQGLLILMASYLLIMELLDLFEDEVDHITKKEVVTKGGRRLECDCLFKCLGFKNRNELLEPYVFHNGLFFDGHANITAICNVNKVVEELNRSYGTWGPGLFVDNKDLCGS